MLLENPGEQKNTEYVVLSENFKINVKIVHNNQVLKIIKSKFFLLFILRNS